MFGLRRATLIALSLALAAGFCPAPAAAQQTPPKSRPLTKKERQKRAQEEAAKKEQEKKDQEAAAAAEEDEKKKKAAAAAAAAAPPPPPAPAPTPPPSEDIEAPKAIFIAADIGYTRADMSTIGASSMAFDSGSANGLILGLSGGLRLREWQYGLRYRIYDASTFTLWSFAASVSYALKYRPLTPILEGHLGYVFDQSIDAPVFKSSLPQGTVLPPDVNVRGVILGGEGSANYWVANWFRLGAFLGFDLMFLSRERAPLPQSVFGPTPEVASLPLYKDSGFGVGVNINLGIRGSFDIAIE
jgi:hypothetical protein